MVVQVLGASHTSSRAQRILTSARSRRLRQYGLCIEPNRVRLFELKPDMRAGYWSLLTKPLLDTQSTSMSSRTSASLASRSSPRFDSRGSQSNWGMVTALLEAPIW